MAIPGGDISYAFNGTWTLILYTGYSSGYRYNSGGPCPNSPPPLTPLVPPQVANDLGLDTNAVNFLRQPGGFLHPDRKFFVGATANGACTDQGNCERAANRPFRDSF